MANPVSSFISSYFLLDIVLITSAVFSVFMLTMSSSSSTVFTFLSFFLDWSFICVFVFKQARSMSLFILTESKFSFLNKHFSGV